MADFGTDVRTFPDLDLSFAVISGPRVLGEALGRRLSTPRGALWWARNYGFDVRQCLASKADALTVERWRAQIVDQCQQDERVMAAGVDFTIAADRRSARLSIRVVTSDGVFRYVYAVNALSVTLLEEAAAA